MTMCKGFSTQRSQRMFHHAVVVGSVAAVLVCLAAARMPAQTDQMYGKSPKLQVRPVKAPNGRFSIEYPRSDWIVLPGGGDVVLSLAQRNGEAVVQVLHSTLKTALAADEITDLFAQLEVDTLKDQDQGAADFQPRVFDAGDRRLIIVQFTQPGLAGRNQVRQYSIPRGQDLYRLICSAAVPLFSKYSAIFSHIAASFTAS